MRFVRAASRVEAIRGFPYALAVAETPTEVAETSPARDIHDLAERQMLDDAEERDLDEAQRPIGGQRRQHGAYVRVQVVEAVLDASRDFRRREARIAGHVGQNERDLGGHDVQRQLLSVRDDAVAEVSAQDDLRSGARA